MSEQRTRDRKGQTNMIASIVVDTAFQSNQGQGNETETVVIVWRVINDRIS